MASEVPVAHRQVSFTNSHCFTIAASVVAGTALAPSENVVCVCYPCIPIYGQTTVVYMMLSDNDIRAALQQGEIQVEPFSEEFIRACGITMHLGAQLLKPLPGKDVDVLNGIVPDYEERLISMSDPYRLQAGEFVLGHTWEKVTVGATLGFFIEGRSTLARVGLTIVQTAMMVYPGHRGRAVTLELANHGVNPILLYPRMKIARAALFRLQTPATELYDDNGKYKEQVAVGRPVFKNEIFNPKE